MSRTILSVYFTKLYFYLCTRVIISSVELPFSELFNIVNKKGLTDLFVISRFECTYEKNKNICITKTNTFKILTRALMRDYNQKYDESVSMKYCTYEKIFVSSPKQKIHLAETLR